MSESQRAPLALNDPFFARPIWFHGVVEADHHRVVVRDEAVDKLAKGGATASGWTAWHPTVL
jgi:hypothetical protein